MHIFCHRYIIFLTYDDIINTGVIHTRYRNTRNTNKCKSPRGEVCFPARHFDDYVHTYDLKIDDAELLKTADRHTHTHLDDFFVPYYPLFAWYLLIYLGVFLMFHLIRLVKTMPRKTICPKNKSGLGGTRT